MSRHTILRSYCMVRAEEPGDGTELHAVVEPSFEPPPTPSRRKAGCDCVWTLLSPLTFCLLVVVFLTIMAYMLCVSIAQGIGMLCMSLIMPSFMRRIYPSPLGKLHSNVLALYRRRIIGKGGHSRTIRIDLLAHPTPPGAAHPDAQTASADAIRYSVHTVACLADNYAYVIVDRSGSPPFRCALVDPCEPDAVLSALKDIAETDYSDVQLLPVAILTTHHHWDHAAGNVRLKKKFPSLAVYGGADDRVAGCTHRMRDGDEAMVGCLKIRAIQ